MTIGDLYGKIEFTVNSRTKPLELELLQKLKKAGCFMLAVGFESGNEKTLKLIKKGATVEDNLQAAKMIREEGLPLFGFFMVGFPWENRDEIINTLKFIFRIDPDFIEIHIAMPYFDTELYAECEKYGTIKSTAWGNDYFSPNTIGTCTVPMSEIKELKKKYLLRFYLRPKYIARKLYSCMVNPTVLMNYAKYGFRLIKNNLLR